MPTDLKSFDPLQLKGRDLRYKDSDFGPDYGIHVFAVEQDPGSRSVYDYWVYYTNRITHSDEQSRFWYICEKYALPDVDWDI